MILIYHITHVVYLFNRSHEIKAVNEDSNYSIMSRYFIISQLQRDHFNVINEDEQMVNNKSSDANGNFTNVIYYIGQTESKI